MECNFHNALIVICTMPQRKKNVFCDNKLNIDISKAHQRNSVMIDIATNTNNSVDQITLHFES